MPTPNETIVTEEQIKKDNERFQELNKKKEEERTEDEKKELNELKERHSSRAEKRIAELTWKSKVAEERAKELEEKLNKSNVEIEELKKLKAEQITARTIKEEFIEIGGKKYYTDEALLAMIDSGKVTEAEAYKYQRQRDKEETIVEVERRQEERKLKETDEEIRIKDAKKVLEKYPHFAKTHSNFNPEDPLYKLSTQLYQEGYIYNPEGLSKSIERAKEILRITDTSIDRTEDLNLETTGVSEKSRTKEKEITLSENEKEIAVKMYCKGDVMNPKTGRPYTVNEAYNRAVDAKKARLKKEE